MGQPDIKTLYKMADAIFPTISQSAVSVNLTGGEPFKYEFLGELVHYLDGFDNIEEINLITNGTVWKPSLFQQIGSIDKVHFIKVSMESGVEAVNDSIRGAGNLTRVKSFLAETKQYWDKPTILMVTLAGYNFETIEQTIEFALREKARGIIFERFVPLGTGKALSDQSITPTQWRSVTGRLWELLKCEPDVDEMADFRAFWLGIEPNGEFSLAGAKCNLGGDSMALMPNGDVYPCRRYPHAVGNVLRQPFGQILNALSENKSNLLCGLR